MPDQNKNQKTGWSSAGWGAAGAGSAATALTYVDRRKSIMPKHTQYLGNTWDEVRKHVKPGDVIIGGNKTAPEAVMNEWRDFVKTYRKKGGGIKGVKAGASQVDIASILSKFGDPSNSHVAQFVTPGQTSYMGGGVQRASYDIPKNLAELDKWRAERKSHHYTLLRPKAPGDSPIVKAMQNKGARAAAAKAERFAGWGEAYDQVGVVKATLKDWLTPKFKSGETAKTTAQRAADLCLKKGVCSTMPAAMGKTTVGGKLAKNVLPQDYFKSQAYDVVGKIGRGSARKTGWMFHLPKHMTRIGAGAAIAAGTYGAIKGVQALKNKGQGMEKKSYDEIYQKAFMEELEKAAAPLTLTDKEKKTLLSASGFLGGMGGSALGSAASVKMVKGLPKPMAAMIAIPTIIMSGKAGNVIAKGFSRTMSGSEAV